MGGTPVAEKKIDDYAKALKADTLKNQGDVLDLAARLELGAINAYLGVIPAFGSRRNHALQDFDQCLGVSFACWRFVIRCLMQCLP